MIKRIQGKEDWEQWQADHVCELGLFTKLADTDTPPEGVKALAWKIIQDAIGGEVPAVSPYIPPPAHLAE